MYSIAFFHHILFSYSSIDRCPICFQSFATKGVLNIFVQIYLGPFPLSLTSLGCLPSCSVAGSQFSGFLGMVPNCFPVTVEPKIIGRSLYRLNGLLPCLNILLVMMASSPSDHHDQRI